MTPQNCEQIAVKETIALRPVNAADKKKRYAANQGAVWRPMRSDTDQRGIGRRVVYKR